MSKYYRANAEVKAAVQEMFDAEEHAKGEALKLSRKHGGSRVTCYTARGAAGEFRIIGFRFNTPPDAKHWCQIKGTKDGWRPKRTGKGKKLDNQLKALRVNKMLTVMKMIGMDWMDDRLHVRHPGIRMVDEDVYLHVTDDVEAPGCERVSDVEMEKIVAEAEAR